MDIAEKKQPNFKFTQRESGVFGTAQCPRLKYKVRSTDLAQIIHSTRSISMIRVSSASAVAPCGSTRNLPFLETGIQPQIQREGGVLRKEKLRGGVTSESRPNWTPPCLRLESAQIPPPRTQ